MIRKILKNKRGNMYISVLISLVVIEFVGLSLLSAVTVTNQANKKSTKTIIANRLAESEIEKIKSDIYEKSISIPYSNTITYPEGYNLKLDVLKVSGTNNLNKISVEVDYKLSSLTGEQIESKVNLESLVGDK